MSPASPAPVRRIPWLRILGGLAVLVLCGLLFRRIQSDRLLAAFAAADWRLVALAALVHLTFNTAARVGRWQALLHPLAHRGGGAGFGELTALYFASQAASNLLPARAGEALRVVLLHRRHDYAVPGLVAVLLCEILVGAVTLGLCTLPMVPLGRAPASLALPITVFALAGPVGLATLLWLARRTGGGAEPSSPAPSPSRGPARFLRGARGLLRRLVGAVWQIHTGRAWARSLAWSALSDLTDVIMIGLVLAAVGVPLSPSSWVVIYAAVNLVLLVPATPAQLGVLELGAVAALQAFGVDGHAALAFALLYHAAHVVPPTLVGAAFLLRYDLRRAVAEEG